MTANKTYQMIIAMLLEYDKATGNGAAKDIINNPHEWKNTFNPFYNNAAAMIIDCREQMDKAAGKTAILPAVKRILKSAINGYNADLRGMIKQGEYFCICDGIRILRLKEDISSLQHIDATKININQIADNLEKDNDFTVDLPTIAELKEACERGKAYEKETGKKPIYELAGGIYVNPFFLLDMMQALPGCTARGKKPVTPLYFEAENGNGVLCPVRHLPGDGNFIINRKEAEEAA